MMTNSAEPTWEPSFEISHASATNPTEEDDILSMGSASSYNSNNQRSTISSHHSTYLQESVNVPWYNMNRRTMIATIIMISLTSFLFVYTESMHMNSFQSSNIVLAHQGGGQQNWAPPAAGTTQEDAVEQERPKERALVHPRDTPAAVATNEVLPNMEDAPPENQPEIILPTDPAYLPPPSLSQADINLLNTPLSPEMIPTLAGFADAWDPHDDVRDVPIFWHIPKSGGSTVKDVIADCHGKVVANENGVEEGHAQDAQLQIININGNGNEKFVNVDTTTQSGLQRAIDLGLVQSNLAELIVTPFLYEAEPLFTTVENDSRGRFFATFRHPVERAVSLYNYLKYAEWESTYNNQVKDMTLEQYISSPFIEDNWMTRRLAGLPDDSEITGEHLLVAMDILRRKFLVGLTSEMDASMDRFERYFQWRYTLNPTQQETCRESLVSGIGSNANRYEVMVPPEGSMEYNLILEKNLFDVELYKYAESLFEEQAAFVEGIPDGFRLVDARCSRCEEEEEVEREAQLVLGKQDAEQMAMRRVLRGQ